MNRKRDGGKEWLTAAEACEHLGISRKTLSRWMREAGLPFRRPGGKVLRFSRAELDRYVDASEAS